VTSAVVKEDEAAAMAAIFSQQTQAWEETQEKMSQYVLRLQWSGFALIGSVQRQSIIIHEEVEHSAEHPNHTLRRIDRCLRAMFATAADRKAIGFKNVPQTTTENSTIDHG